MKSCCAPARPEFSTPSSPHRIPPGTGARDANVLTTSCSEEGSLICVYIYIYIYIYVERERDIPIDMYVHIYIYIYTCIHTHIHY